MELEDPPRSLPVYGADRFAEVDIGCEQFLSKLPLTLDEDTQGQDLVKVKEYNCTVRYKSKGFLCSF